MFVLPDDLGFCESFALSWSWRRIGDLSDEVRSGRLGNTVHQDTDERRSQDDSEGKSKAEQNAFAISEPSTLLLRRELDSTEIRLQLLLLAEISFMQVTDQLPHQTSRRKVGM